MSKLQNLRKAAVLSQSQLAEKCGISVRTLQDYEQGYRNINGIGILRAKSIADALGCRIEDLIEDETK